MREVCDLCFNLLSYNGLAVLCVDQWGDGGGGSGPPGWIAEAVTDSEEHGCRQGLK